MNRANNTSRGPAKYSLGCAAPSKALGLCIALVLGACCLRQLSGTLPQGENRKLNYQASAGGVKSSPEANKLENGVPDIAFSSLPRARPRILTILTTYDENAEYIKAYKRGLKVRQDGFKPQIFVATNSEDESSADVVDFKTGERWIHRLSAAISRAVHLYHGQFDWLAIGDDDTAFLYNRATAFLSHIDHTKPLLIGETNGLDMAADYVDYTKCWSPTEKNLTNNRMAAQGCCNDFTNPCFVPAFPDRDDYHYRWIRPDGYGDYRAYGPNGLFWPFGGSGFFMSAGMAVDVIGAMGWKDCARRFSDSPTDMQVAQCLKLYGYSIGDYRSGFFRGEIADASLLKESLQRCQVLGVHIGVHRLLGGDKFPTDDFEDAVEIVQAVDAAFKEEDQSLAAYCPAAWHALSEWL